MQFAETVKNVFFGVLVLAGALLAIFSAYGINNPFSTPVYPVTWRMLELGGGGFTLFILAIVTFYSGELVWRERDAQLNQIMDALPVRRWVLFGSKLVRAHAGPGCAGPDGDGLRPARSGSSTAITTSSSASTSRICSATG